MSQFSPIINKIEALKKEKNTGQDANCSMVSVKVSV